MKRFLALLMLAGGLLMASGANAVPITWTIPATTLSVSCISISSINSISGTFVYDANTNTTSSINLSSTICGTTTTLTYAGSNDGGYVRFQGAAVAVVSSTPSAYLRSTGLTNAGGSVTISVNDLGNGLCNGASDGICTSAGFTGTNSSSVTVTGVAVASIPTVTLNTANLAINATTLTIDGTGFDATAGNNTVVFNNGAVGSVSAATATQLTVTFTTPPTSTGSMTAVVTTNGQSSGSAVQVATVVLAPQATLVVVPTPGSINVDGTSTLSTTGGSGSGLVSYSLVSGPCTLSGATLTGTGAGSCVSVRPNQLDYADIAWFRRRGSNSSSRL